jgi:aryl-alcohol dehydrogenase-like predicted oxidoreductase
MMKQPPLQLPRIVVGTASMGSLLPFRPRLASSAAAFGHLDALLDLGCTAFDTAAVYQLGGTERLLGEWMHARGNRARVFLITKGGHPSLLTGGSRLGRKALESDLHDSLKRLRTDRVDLYLTHRDDPSRPVESVVEVLADFVKAGKIAAYGFSNWTHERVAAARQVAAAKGLPGPAASSPHFSLIDWVSVPWAGCVSIAGEAGRAARELYAREQIPVLAWSPIGRGFFSGREPDRACLRTYGSEANFARKRRAEELAARRGVSAAQIAMAWLFHQPFPVHAVVAASTAARMRQNLDAAELKLSEGEIRWLESGDGGGKES